MKYEDPMFMHCNVPKEENNHKKRLCAYMSFSYSFSLSISHIWDDYAADNIF